MKKVLWGFLAIALALCIVPNVKALTNYKLGDWQTTMPNDEVGEDVFSKQAAGSKESDPTDSSRVIIKGRADEVSGMKLGPYVEGDTTTVSQGINEELSIVLGPEELKSGELFEVSLSLKDPEQKTHYGYVNEVNVVTQNVDGNNIEVKINGIEDNLVATITKSGVYKYSWNVKKTGEDTILTFKVTDEDGKTVGEEKQVNIEETFPVGSYDRQNITDNTTMRWLWFCNVKADHVKLVTKADEPAVTPTEPAKPDTTVTVEKSENLNQILKDSLKESLGDKYNYDDVNITVQALETKKENEKIKEEVKKKLPDAKIVKYLDINVEVTNKANEHLDYITDLTKEIKLSVEIPKDLPAIADGYTRKYYIIRQHGDEITIINPTVSKDGKTLSFSSDKFSTYALAYSDSIIAPEKNKEDAKNPNTSDMIVPLISVLSVSVVGIGYILKKRLFN